MNAIRELGAWRIAMFGAFALAVVAAHGVTLHMGYRVLEKYEPDWTSGGLLRLALSAAAAVFLIAAIRPDNSEETGRDDYPTWLFGAMAVTTFTLLYASALAVVLWPDRIHTHVVEGGILSILTEFLLLGALFFLVRSVWRARDGRAEPLFGIGAPVVLGLMVLVVVVLLGEEASWGQHWIGWSTPEAFEGNIQNETNLHNFYTHRFEMAYYTTAVLAFVLLPYGWPANPPAWLRPASLYVPPRTFAIALLPLCGFMFNTWNFVFFQIWFFAGLLIALDAVRREKAGDVVFTAVAMGGALLGAQIIFLLRGHTMFRGHELTEVREFIIAVAVLAYCFVLWRRVAGLQERSSGRVDLAAPIA